MGCWVRGTARCTPDGAGSWGGGGHRDRRSEANLGICAAAGVRDVGNEPISQCLCGGEEARRQRELAGPSVPDDARQPLQRAHVRRDGDIDLLDAECGVGGTDADVAGGYDVDGRPDAGPMDCRDDRLAAGLEGSAGIL